MTGLSGGIVGLVGGSSRLGRRRNFGISDSLHLTRSCWICQLRSLVGGRLGLLVAGFAAAVEVVVVRSSVIDAVVRQPVESVRIVASPFLVSASGTAGTEPFQVGLSPRGASAFSSKVLMFTVCSESFRIVGRAFLGPMVEIACSGCRRG